MSGHVPGDLPRARRAGGRNARRAARAAPDAHPNPAPPGQRGGAYAPLRRDEIERVYRAALRILDEIGMGDAPPGLVERALARGARVNDLGRLAFPAALVEDLLAGAARTFVLHGRRPAHDLEVGGDRVWFGTGGAAVQTLDLDTGHYRAATLRDVYDFARLADALVNVSWFTRCSVATDLADLLALDVNTAYALAAGTEKPVGTSFSAAAHVEPVVELFDRVLGGADRFRERPFCQAHVSPVISPLRYGADAVAVAEACVRHRVPVNCIIAAQCGATAPAALAGMLATTTAETLAGLLMVNLFGPGHPTVFSNWPLAIDLRTGAFAGGGGEVAVLNAAAAQIGRWLGLPTGVACSMSDAKAVDAQMGAEKALSALAAALAGANLVYESAGMTASLLGASFEAFVLDDEMLSHVCRVLRGIEVSDETLDVAPVRAAVTGPGHFLSSPQTLAAMQRDFFYPRVADRLPPGPWAALGARDAATAARERARELLAAHRPWYIDASADAAIRRRFDIRLERRSG